MTSARFIGMQVKLGYDGVRASEKPWNENKVSGENNRRHMCASEYCVRAPRRHVYANRCHLNIEC